MKTRKRIPFLIMAIAMLFAMVTNALAANDMSSNFDVVFVVDGSGSMKYSDPDRIYKEAVKLFLDMCEYDSTRVGFVQYAHVLRGLRELRPVAEISDRVAFKSAIDALEYDGDTDIALGLTEAKRILLNAGSLNSDRHPIILLLSDGNTDLPDGPRTVEASNNELENTLMELQAFDVPVYAIGLNYNGKLNTATMEHIASSTGGTAYETKSADPLPEILSEIFAKNIESGEIEVGKLTGDGNSHDININIPNSSIYEANIIIRSGKQVTDLRLCDPSGTERTLPDENIMLSASKSYTLIKLYRPSKGEWKLSLTGAKGDDVTINLLSYYGMGMDVNVFAERPDYDEAVDMHGLQKGDSIVAEVSFTNREGAMDDPQLLSGATGTIFLIDAQGQQYATKELAVDGTHMKGRFTLDDIEPGGYTLGIRVLGADNSFDKSSDPISIVVLPPTLSLTGDGEKSVRLVPIFSKSATVNLDDVVNLSPNMDLKVEPTSKEWKDICNITFDEEALALEVSALKSGSAETEMRVTDQYGQEVTFLLKISVFPLMLVAVLLLLVIAAIVFAALKFFSRNKAALSGTISLEMDVPDPPVSESVNLVKVGGKKGKHPFMDIIHAISTTDTREDYIKALAPLMGFVSGMAVEKKKSDPHRLYIYIPRPPHGWRVQVNGIECEAARTDCISSSAPYFITCATDSLGEEQYKLQISYNDASGKNNEDILDNGDIFDTVPNHWDSSMDSDTNGLPDFSDDDIFS